LAWYAIWFDLEPGPPEKLPAVFGLIEAAEEHGLVAMVRSGGGWRRLPEGVLGGRFPDARAAFEAFERALHEGSDLLGFPRRLAAELPD
jgi:hypothetical protein